MNNLSQELIEDLDKYICNFQYVDKYISMEDDFKKLNDIKDSIEKRKTAVICQAREDEFQTIKLSHFGREIGPNIGEPLFMMGDHYRMFWKVSHYKDNVLSGSIDLLRLYGIYKTCSDKIWSMKWDTYSIGIKNCPILKYWTMNDGSNRKQSYRFRVDPSLNYEMRECDVHPNIVTRYYSVIIDNNKEE